MANLQADRGRENEMRMLLMVLLLASCATQPRMERYSLDFPIETAPAKDQIPLSLVVERPSMLPGYDTAAMAYMTIPHRIDYFAKNRWVDTPGAMLYPILVESLSRRFAKVSRAPSKGDMHLHTEIVMLRQEFSGNSSRIHLVLRETASIRGKSEAKIFESFEDCTENDPYGGVIAANRAVARLMREISDYCASLQ